MQLYKIIAAELIELYTLFVLKRPFTYPVFFKRKASIRSPLPMTEMDLVEQRLKRQTKIIKHFRGE